MGEGDPRSSIATATLDPRELARLAKESATHASAEDPADSGRAAPPLTGRTVTLDDPLTTSLLAEVTRTARTLEMTREQLDAALARAAQPDDAAADPAAVPAIIKDRRR